MLQFFLFICLSVSIVSIFLYKRIYIKTSSMAVVMAIGILTHGVFFNFFGSTFEIGRQILGIIDLSLWLSFFCSIVMTLFTKKFIDIHYKHPINRFGIGTWVAGTSICGIILTEQLNQWALLFKIIFFMDLGLWCIYIGICIVAFYEINKTNLSQNVHGLLLLPTVSTQSIVLLYNTVFEQVPILINVILILLGFSLYFISAFFIVRRYLTYAWSIESDWSNTNCILHGALSITGLACITTEAMDQNLVMDIWIFTAIMFLFVELIESYRLVKRIKSFGLMDAFFIYDVSQWSRIFTFSMFYTFTFLVQYPSTLFLEIQNLIVLVGFWLVLALVSLEISIIIGSLVRENKLSSQRYNGIEV